MTYRIIQPTRPMLACDTFGGVSSATAAAFLAKDFGAVGLYPAVSSANELAWVTGAGMGVWWILEGLAPTTMPTADLGKRLAEAACEKVASFGVSAGATFAVDLEDASGPQSTKLRGWSDFSDAATQFLVAAGHIGVPYIGSGLGMTASQIYSLHGFPYWKSESQVPEPSCGWSMIQIYPGDILHPSGVKVDYDLITHDYRGRTISLVVSA